MFWHKLTKNSGWSQYFVLNGVVTEHLMVTYPPPHDLIMVTYPPHPMLRWLPSASSFSWWPEAEVQIGLRDRTLVTNWIKDTINAVDASVIGFNHPQHYFLLHIFLATPLIITSYHPEINIQPITIPSAFSTISDSFFLFPVVKSQRISLFHVI